MTGELLPRGGISDTLNPAEEFLLENVAISGMDILSYAWQMPDREKAEGLKHFGASLRSYLLAATSAMADGSRLDEEDRRRAQEWDNSRLRMSELSKPRDPLLDASSLVSSLRTGRIRAISGIDQSTAEALRDYTEQALRSLGVTIEIGDEPVWPTTTVEYSNADRGLTPSGMPYSAFLREAFRQTESSQSLGKYRYGPRYELLLKPHNNAVERLDGLGVNASPDIFHPVKYQEKVVKDYVISLDDGTQTRIDMINSDRMKSLRASGSIIYENDNSKALTPGVLDDPGYCRQSRGDSCVATGFRMIFKGITGEALNDQDVDLAQGQMTNPPILPTETYLNVLGSDIFKKEYRNKVVTIMFAGMDLSTIAEIAKNVKARQAGALVFCVVNLNSETTHGGTWHTNVLLETDGDNVITHDPARSLIYGAPRRKLRKASFYRRWATTGNSGYIVISR